MNKIQALVLVLAMSISGGVMAGVDAGAAGAAGGAGGAASGWGAPVSKVVAPVHGAVGANAGFILFAGGLAATIAGSVNVTSTSNH